MSQPTKIENAIAAYAAQLRARSRELDATAAENLERPAADIDEAVGLRNGRAPLPTDRLWTGSETAYYLGVSARYLRESSCPKVLLPGNGKKGQPLVRYDPAQVREWWNSWNTRPPLQEG